jgi:hypothetical protein
MVSGWNLRNGEAPGDRLLKVLHYSGPYGFPGPMGPLMPPPKIVVAGVNGGIFLLAVVALAGIFQ